jgi:hypothetical protein
MFTALILMCVTETMKSHDQCVLLTSDIFFETSRDCEADIFNVITSGELLLLNPGKIPVDFYCVNWSAPKA